MRRGLLACIASVVLLPATAAGSAAAADPTGTQAIGQTADNLQSASSTATSTQVQPTNQDISVRIMSPGNDGAVTQTNSSAATSAAGNTNTTAQQALQSAGAAGQAALQAAAGKQSADSSATSTQVNPSNQHIAVRIMSPGDAGSVTQANSSAATSAAGNANDTTQHATQAGGTAGSQSVGQDAASEQDAGSHATSTQVKPSNQDIPVRIMSPGDDGSVTQVNSSSATSAAGNRNATTQRAQQSAGDSSPEKIAARSCCQPGGVTVQGVGQSASNDQAASSSADSTQVGASNVAAPVRISSPGDGGTVRQANSSRATSAAGNANDTTQQTAQAAGGDGGTAVQAIGQQAANEQDAASHATSTQVHPSNQDIPVRIMSAGSDGSVTQVNSSSATSAAGNANTTTQDADQSGGGLVPVREPCRRCGSPGGTTVQGVGQFAANDQDARSSADSTQVGASNASAPLRIDSAGGGGQVLQANGSDARSAAGNRDATDQSAEQSADGSGGGTAVQAIGQAALSDQDASSRATSTQVGASNVDDPVRIGSPGDDGAVRQANLSSAMSAAGNDNATTQDAEQSGGAPVLVPVRGGCELCRPIDGGTVEQGIGQFAANDQEAASSADSTQVCPSNDVEPVRLHSAGGGGSVGQFNDSAAKSAAGNRNGLKQRADQDAMGDLLRLEPLAEGLMP
ncbi:MAG: hypothetical protein QOI62_1279 [Solirubrobacteraceae bacterium]|jgi:hypothetical protein|nr:hypothetical protein [Solirubrobacteraceae bacterium]